MSDLGKVKRKRPSGPLRPRDFGRTECIWELCQATQPWCECHQAVISAPANGLPSGPSTTPATVTESPLSLSIVAGLGESAGRSALSGALAGGGAGGSAA